MSGSKTPSSLPLNGLLEIALASVLDEFRKEIEESEFSDVRPAHRCVFRYMKEGGMRLTEIAERANTTKQSAGEVVDDLVALGYAERVPDPEDRRAKLVCLTERGQAARAFGFQALAEIEQRWEERYGAERIAALRTTLEEIAATEAPYTALVASDGKGV